MTLFTKKRQLKSYFDSFEQTLKSSVDRIPKDKILSKTNDELIDEYNLNKTIDTPQLQSDGVKPDDNPRKIKKNVTGDLRYHVMGDKRTNGQVIKEFTVFVFRVPVTGTIGLLDYDEINDLFDPTGKDRTPVDGQISGSNVIIQIEQLNVDGNALKNDFINRINHINGYINHLRPIVENYKLVINSKVQSLLNIRREELKKIDDIGKHF